MTALQQVSPTGRQHQISHGDQAAVIVEVGGGLRTYTVGDRAVIDGYDVEKPADGGRGQMLLPWPNRVRDGRWTWDNQPLQLALSEPDLHNAIHGLVRWLTWEMVERTPASVEVECVLHPQRGYPWMLKVRNSYMLTSRGLAISSTVTNLSPTAAPVAFGFHPYLAANGRVDDCTLEFTAKSYLATDDQQIPVARRPVARTPLDFGQPRQVGDLALDTAFTELRRGRNGQSSLSFTDAAGHTVRFWTDERYPFVQLFSGDTLEDRPRRRTSLAVEPMTAPANALATGESLIVLQPAASETARWGLDVG